MRILEISTSGGVGRPVMGPVTNDITQLANQFSLSGEHVTVLDAKTVSGWTEEQARVVGRPRFPGGAELVESCVANIGSQGRLRRKLGFQPREAHLAHTITDEFLRRFDVVHTHEAAVTTLLARRHPCVVYTCHTPNRWVELSQRDSIASSSFVRIQEAFGLHDFSAISAANTTIALGQHVERALKVRRPRIAAHANIIVIPNGTEIEHWPIKAVADARETIGAAPDVQRLVMVARLDPSKGVDVLLNALNEPALRARNLVVDIIGRGSKQHYLDSCQSPGIDVRFHGFISNRDDLFHNLIAAADLMVVPSLFDNQPNVVLEGLAMGVPVVGSRAGAIPEMLDPSVGCVFERGNSAELASVLGRLLDDPDRLAEMKRASRSYVSEEYSWASSASKHLELFAELSKTNPSRQSFPLEGARQLNGSR